MEGRKTPVGRRGEEEEGERGGGKGEEGKEGEGEGEGGGGRGGVKTVTVAFYLTTKIVTEIIIIHKC